MQDVRRVLANGDMGAKKQVFQRFLAQPDGEPGPVTLYYSISQQDSGRYRGTLVRGALGIVPLAEREDGEDVSSHGKEWLPDEDSNLERRLPRGRQPRRRGAGARLPLRAPQHPRLQQGRQHDAGARGRGEAVVSADRGGMEPYLSKGQGGL